MTIWDWLKERSIWRTGRSPRWRAVMIKTTGGLEIIAAMNDRGNWWARNAWEYRPEQVIGWRELTKEEWRNK